jgi:anti-sigma B factor antagonist
MFPIAFAKLLDHGLDIKQRERDGIAIIDLDGRLVQGEEDMAVRQHLDALASAGQKNVILNLNKVSEIDTTGQGSLEYCADKFRKLGGKCVLLHLDPADTKVPDMFELSTDFETYEDEVDAVNSFFPDRKVPRYDILDFVAKLKTEASEESQAAKT